MIERHFRCAQERGNAGGAARTAQLFNTALAHHQRGDLAAAEQLYRQILAGEPQHAGSLHFLGVLAYQLGQFEQAIELIGRAIASDGRVALFHGNLGNVLLAAGRLDAAIGAYEHAQALAPQDAQAQCNLGMALAHAGRREEAAARFERALSLQPAHADAHFNLGNARLEQGRSADAVISLRRAIALKPDYAGAHNSLGYALMDGGDAAGAIASYRRALALNPDYVEAHNNLGNALLDQTDFDGAIACFERALALQPELAAAHANLGATLLACGNAVAALRSLRRAHELADTTANRALLCNCLGRLAAADDVDDLRDLIVRALGERWTRPHELATIAAREVMRNTALRDCAGCVAAAWPQRPAAAALIDAAALAALAGDALLRVMLETATICDPALERCLTALRHALLERALQAAGDEAVALTFACALARQCFINEYVYDCADDEAVRAVALRKSVEAVLQANAAPAPLQLAVLAAYFPLYTLAHAERLPALQAPAALAALIVRQVGEPLEERRLADQMPRLTPIVDAVSLKVQSQYEENPYPRWTGVVRAGEALPLDAVIARRFPRSPLRPLGKRDGVEVLIAGCGSGQHPVDLAQRLAGARLLAVDISMASLCYAQRMTRAAGIENIDYAQADILQLGSLERSFDLIESSGVLHHLADPWAGWQVLLSRLRPGGFMRLGFYSELARRDIVATRDFIAARGYAATADDIRRCRREMLAMAPDTAPARVTMLNDFFSMSECRDLLFHVQEHRLTLPAIGAFLAANALTLIGFYAEAALTQAYRTRFAADTAMTDLANWHVFETENPDAFAGMYQFLVQKAA
jgi:tetratricopeptide (TPR) repeat protein